MSYRASVKTPNLIAHAAAVILTAAMAAVAVAVYGADISALLLFAAFMIVYVMVPGYAIINLLKIRSTHLSTLLALSLYSGWALSVLAYFVSDMLHTDVIVAAAGPLATIAFIVWAVRRPDDFPKISVREHLAKIPVSFCIFFVLVLFYAMIRTQYLYMSPQLSEFIYVNPDKAYHMGLIDSLSHDYPLLSPWIQGRYINYHIFTEVLYSIPVRLFGMESDALLMTCGPYLTAFAICTSMYSLFAELSRRPERAGIYCLIVMLANPFAAKSFYYSVAFKFIITNDNTSGYGVMSAIGFIVLLKIWLDEYKKRGERIPAGMTVLLTAFMMLAAGIKGPMAIVLLAAFWGTMILGFILKQAKPNLLIPAFALTAGFAVVYVTILGAKGRGTSTGGKTLFDFANITNICFWKKPLTNIMKSMSIPLPARLAVLMAVFMLFYLTVFLLPLIVGYIRELFLVLTKRKEFVFHEVMVYASFLVGLAAMFLLRYSGHSQIYFGLLSLFLAPLIAYWYLEDAGNEYSASTMAKKRVYEVMLAVSLLILACTTFTLGVCFCRLVPEAVAHADRGAKYGTYTSISNDEYLAMEWIENNTPKDALLATDRYYSVPLDQYTYDNRWANRFFLYAAYSNRFCYIAGSGYNLGRYDWPIRLEMIKKNAELYDPLNDERGDTARELGVDYVVVSKRFTDVKSLENEDYELCYQNDDVDIYKVKD